MSMTTGGAISGKKVATAKSGFSGSHRITGNTVTRSQRVTLFGTASTVVKRTLTQKMADVDDECELSGDMPRSVRQLWSTQMKNMQQHASTRSNVGYCVCCVRPVPVNDPGTRKMAFCGLFVDILQNCTVDKNTLLYNEQCRLLRAGHVDKHVFVCFICLPSWKKSITQFESRRSTETPSLFMYKSNAFVNDSAEKTDKLSLLKYVLCATSEVLIADTGEKIFHPIRTTDFVVLEAIIVFFKSLFLKYDCNVRDFSRMFCHFQIVSIVRWHVGGFPLIMAQNRQTQDLRKALRGEIGKLYHEVWGFADDFVAIQNGSVANTEHGSEECAACVHQSCGKTHTLRSIPQQSTMHTPRIQENSLENANTKPASASTKTLGKRRSYDTFFLKDWNYITENIAHSAVFASEETAVMPSQTITCRHCLQQSVVSYSFYHKISHKFPKKFRQRNMQRYYSRLMREPSDVIYPCLLQQVLGERARVVVRAVVL